MIKIICVLALICVSEGAISGQNLKTGTQEYNRVIKVGMYEEVRPFSELFSRVDYVPLETREGALVGNIDKALISGELLFILDKTQKSVLSFGTDGRYKGKFHNPGNGPNEYLEIYDFDLLPSGKGLVFLADNKRLFILDNNLAFQNVIKAPWNGVGIAAVTPSVYGFYTSRWLETTEDGTGNLYNLILGDLSTGKTKGFFSGTLAKRIRFTGTSRFFRSDVLAYVEPFDNRCNFLSSGGIDSVWFFDFGKMVLNQKDLEKIQTFNEYLSLASANKGIVTEIDDIKIKGNLAYFSYRVVEGPRPSSQTQHQCFLNLTSGIYYPVRPPVNDLSSLRFPGIFLGTFAGGYFAQIPSFLLGQEGVGDIPSSLRKAGVADNPVMVFYYVRK
jgi:hypothetical protein